MDYIHSAKITLFGPLLSCHLRTTIDFRSSRNVLSTFSPWLGQISRFGVDQFYVIQHIQRHGSRFRNEVGKQCERAHVIPSLIHLVSGVASSLTNNCSIQTTHLIAHRRCLTRRWTKKQSNDFFEGELGMVHLSHQIQSQSVTGDNWSFRSKTINKMLSMK